MSGGLGAKVFDHLAKRSEQKFDDVVAVRKELWEQVERQDARIQKLETEVNEWREKYFTQRDELANQKVEVAGHKAEIADLKLKLAEALTEISTLRLQLHEQALLPERRSPKPSS